MASTLTSEVIKALTRHFLTAIGPLIIMYTSITPDVYNVYIEVGSLLAGFGFTIWGLVMSYKDKKKKVKTIAEKQ